MNPIEAASVIVLLLSARLWFSLIKRKASQYTARGYLIRQNNSIDLKIETSQMLCDQSIPFPLPFPLLTLPSGEYPRPHRRVSGRWSNSWTPSLAVVLRDEDRRRRRRRWRGRSSSQCDQCGKWNVDLLHEPAGKHHRQQWVGRKERDGDAPLCCLTYLIISCRWIQVHEVSQLLSCPRISTSVLACVCVFQFPVAGGAPRGWIMLCTALMCWPPSRQWLCLTFFTPPTGSPLT